MLNLSILKLNSPLLRLIVFPTPKLNFRRLYTNCVILDRYLPEAKTKLHTEKSIPNQDMGSVLSKMINHRELEAEDGSGIDDQFTKKPKLEETESNLSTLNENEETSEEVSEKPKEVYKRPKQPKKKNPKPNTSDPVILMDLHELNPKLINSVENHEYIKGLFYKYLPYERFSEVEVDIVKMASNGNGIGVNSAHPEWFITVPFTCIGDKVITKIFSHSKGYSEGDLVKLVSRGKTDCITPPCQYAGICSGCQWQHLTYADQLKLKEDYLKRAFLYGARPAFHRIKFVEPEHSPLKFAYRTKLTPHFDLPKPPKPSSSNAEPAAEPISKEPVVKIGFMEKGRKRVLDIEDCMLATPPVSEGFKQERVKVEDIIKTYKRGATLIVRESLKKDSEGNEEIGVITNHKDLVVQPVGDLRFKYPAGSFFQVNSSILPRLTEYVMDEFKSIPLAQPPKYLLDVYCGSGLFAVACSPAFEKVVGVDVNDQSITFASQNAELNKVDNCSFMLGSAEVIFNGLEFNGDDTAVIIDPPRKGCSEDFIKQLIEFGPSSIVYVSCNPFTQAEDLQMLLNLTGGESSQLLTDPDTTPVNSETFIQSLSPDYVSPAQAKEEWSEFTQKSDKTILKQYEGYLGLNQDELKSNKPKFTYKVVKVKPFDMFPQTKHIESLLTLVKVPLP